MPALEIDRGKARNIGQRRFARLKLWRSIASCYDTYVITDRGCVIGATDVRNHRIHIAQPPPDP